MTVWYAQRMAAIRLPAAHKLLFQIAALPIRSVTIVTSVPMTPAMPVQENAPILS